MILLTDQATMRRRAPFIMPAKLFSHRRFPLQGAAIIVRPTLRGRHPPDSRIGKIAAQLQRSWRGAFMPEMLLEYLPILIFTGIAVVMAVALILVAFVVAENRPDPEKLSAYECGFPAFDDSRMQFDVRFYLVAILFIIFDLEVAFLFPWAISLGDVGLYGFWSMMVFLGVLTIGFAYEWKKGALEWE